MSVRTVLEIFDERVAASGDAPALRTRRDGRWISITWNEWYRDVDRFARSLIALGVQRGDRVLLLARNRVEWLVADLAIMQVGAVTVPIYASTLPRHCAWTIQNADVRWAIVEDPHQLEKLLSQEEELVSLERIVLLDDVASLDSPDKNGRVVVSLRDLDLNAAQRAKIVGAAQAEELAAELAARDPNAGQARRREIQLQDLATIVYTSGTTGTPRGVMLTHENLAAEALGNALALPLTEHDRHILLLPLSQVFARAIYLTSILVGCVTSFSRGSAHLQREFLEERPTFFVGVPAIFERFASRAYYGRVGRRAFTRDRLRNLGKLAQKRSRVAQGTAALNVVDRLMLAVGDRTLFRDMRQSFGGKLRFVISGGAPVSSFLTEVYLGIGVPIYEGYGLTETSGAATVNSPAAWRVGSVGQPLRDVEVKIDTNGEVLIRGPLVSPGYWRDEEATEAAWVDGWFRTGDIGVLVDGFLTITDRRKDMIFLRTGKGVSPQRVETQLQSIPVVKRAVVAGDGEDHLVALLTLDEELLRTWVRSLKNKRYEELSYEEICLLDEVYDELRVHIDGVNAELRSSEQVQRFAIIPKSFSPETGELTPTYRVRRRFVLEKYRALVEGLRASGS